MNYIGIDISLNSTAISIESDKGSHVLSFTNKKDNNIYIKELDRYGVKFFHYNRVVSKDYSENEVLKLKHYNMISKQILEEIVKRINLSQKTHCQIEGYSFSKNTSSILDIVSLSTLIRSNLILGINDIDITIISPSTLKLEACKLCYTPINIGKKKPKYEYRNNEGMSGGSFKKPQMYRAMIEGEIKSPIYEMLISYKDLMDRDKIPNPIEDIIDSIFACKIKIKEIETNKVSLV
jgi:hypothetical protein